jgi:uncharacterized glyoxalase superfamily protein PhnB
MDKIGTRLEQVYLLRVDERKDGHVSAIRCNVEVVTLFEEDLDQAKEFCTRVFGNVTLIDGSKDTAWGTRTAHVADLGGHIWEVAQDLDPQPGS